MVHYNQKPFDTVTLISAEGLSDCVIAPPLRNFRFDMDKIWPEEDKLNGSFEQSDSPKRSKRRNKYSDGEFDQEETDSDDDKPKD